MTENARIYFNHFPDEVIMRILQSCSFRAIIRYSTTDRRGYNLVKSSVVLQFQIELEVNRLEIMESASDATTRSLLEDVIRYRDAWAGMNFGPTVELPMPKDRILLWELREGSFISAYSTTRGPKLADALQVVPLDTQQLPKPIEFGLNFDEFTLDLSQELVVLAVVDLPRKDQVRLLLRSSKTSLSHPLAKKPIILVLLEFPLRPREASSITLEIMGDILVAKFADIESLAYEILIWNWKTTTLLNRISSRTGVCDLGFLDKQTLILYHAAASDGSALRRVALLVYQDFRKPLAYETISSDIHVTASNHRSLDYSFCFAFPKIDRTMSVLPPALALRSDPIPGRLMHKTGHTKFASTHAGTIGLILPLSYDTHIQPQDVTYRIFVNTSKLFDFMSSHPRSREFEWTEWGEYTTRWFNEDNQQADWISWVSGSRYLRSSPGQRFSSLTLSVVDFCPFAAKRHPEPDPDLITPPNQPLKGRNANIEQRWIRALREWWIRPGWSDSDERVLVDVVGSETPSIVEIGFKSPVTSRLGWRSVTMAKPVASNVWLIHGGYIVGKDFRGFGARANQMIVRTLQA
ncbi:unnamed protein product [Rhizoctonia solani]|uniref:F-box domain-containing protein n=1 Tax=Rhizoctonia solani TaxID=456999 RepID=A0A8H3A0W2_9AGAM|nr:unnamed protein product [Rhizoctonia solani]